MTQLEVLLAGVILAIIGHGIIVLYRSPKELFNAIEEKMVELEDNHTTLDRMLTRHDEVVKNLVGAIDRLTQRIDRIEPYIKPPGRRGG
jgi:type II secretory pathway component PulJ